MGKRIPLVLKEVESNEPSAGGTPIQRGLVCPPFVRTSLGQPE